MPVKCYCGNEKLEEYSEHYLKCPLCHTLVSKVDFNKNIYKVDDEETNLYGKNYWEDIMVKEAGVENLDDIITLYLKERALYWLKYILRYIPLDQSVAEVGCGLGQLAYLMKTIGYRQKAFELSPYICNYIRENMKISVQCGELKDSVDRFDAVLAFDVFEHLLSPVEFLDSCVDKLHDHGVLCLQTPCYDDNLAYEEMLKEKPRFEGLLVENQHIYIYSKKAISQLLKDRGFKYIQFEQPYFGDDYDMFLFASKEPMEKVDEKQIDQSLDIVNGGRIIKAMFALTEEKDKLIHRLKEIEADSYNRLLNNQILEKDLKESERDRAEKLIVIATQQQQISNQLKEIEELKNRMFKSKIKKILKR